MLTYDEVLNMNYYKKTSYTGWMGGMRFLIKKEQPPTPEVVEGEEPLPAPDPLFRVWIWPGPYIYDLTDVSKKFTATFPFTEEGRCQSVDWINDQYELHKDLWTKRKIENYD